MFENIIFYQRIIMKVYIGLICIALALICTVEARTVYRDGKAMGEHVIIGTKEFFMSSEYTDVMTAIKNCAELDMKLISLDNKDQNTIVKSFIASYDPLGGTSYWTSGRKFRVYWQWGGNGRLFSVFTDWESGMPNSGLQEDICVGLKPSGWFDGGCRYNTNRYICEHLV